MKKNIKNEVLVKHSFSKINSIVENTIQMYMGGGSKNLGCKNLVRTKYSLKTILFGICLLLLTMQCSKSTSEPVATPTPDGTITCKVGESKDASGKCVANTCDAGKIKNASGVCEACPSGQVVSNNSCITPSVAPDAPTGFTATVEYNNLRLNWAQTNGASEFIIYWSTSSANFNIASASILNTASYTIVHSSLLTGVTYYYKLFAKNNIGTSSSFASASGTPVKPLLTNCGGTVGINGPSVVIYKWITTGAGDALTYSDPNVQLPNSRILTTFIKGCDGGAVGSVQQDLTTVRTASLYYQNYLSSTFNKVSDVFNIGQSPVLALSTSRNPVFSNPSNETIFTMELRDGTNAIVAQIGILNTLNAASGVPYFGGCFTNTQYVSINLSLGYATVTGTGAKTFATPNVHNPTAYTCLDFATPSSVTEVSFPRVGRAEMNKLLQAAGKNYTIPTN